MSDAPIGFCQMFSRTLTNCGRDFLFKELKNASRSLGDSAGKLAGLPGSASLHRELTSASAAIRPQAGGSSGCCFPCPAIWCRCGRVRSDVGQRVHDRCVQFRSLLHFLAGFHRHPGHQAHAAVVWDAQEHRTQRTGEVAASGQGDTHALHRDVKVLLAWAPPYGAARVSVRQRRRLDLLCLPCDVRNIVGDRAEVILVSPVHIFRRRRSGDVCCLLRRLGSRPRLP
jgi:hypothetical protein